MNWSISKAKMFEKCQRKWVYSEIMASKHSKDVDRNEAYFLKQLGSIHSWRGKIVDYIIETFLVPELNNKKIPNINDIERKISDIMEKQLDFARLKKYRNLNLTKKEASLDFCALRELETSEGLKDSDVDMIKQQVIESLKNLLESELMEILLGPNTYLVAQKNLSYKFHDVNIISRPDLIVYFQNKPPLIIDWKVYFYRQDNAWMQLGCYAIALTECTPVDYFQKPIDDPTEIDLLEYQLLKNEQFTYKLTHLDLKKIRDYIYDTSKRMHNQIKSRKYGELDFNQFKTTNEPEVCKYCNFKSLCKNKKVKYQVNLMKFIKD